MKSQLLNNHNCRVGIANPTNLLKQLEKWRYLLAINIVFLNHKIIEKQLNFAVQMIINRLIFLRICEDKGLEKSYQLFNLLESDHIYQELTRIFLNSDHRYNVSLFNFTTEKKRDNFDDFTLNLKIDNQPLRTILRKLYPPESPYKFSVIPIEILGQVYEQFLGKVINLSVSHQVIIEDKPEVRKAGGVYYTPSYIVDYIIANTIGKVLEGKKPEKIGDLSILDPSCGSGSFLIVAYTFLLNWYLDQYIKNTKKYQSKIYQKMGGEFALTSAEKKRILLTHIYGVDIDQQAVETTKLSLLLKVLEGESEETVNQQLQFLKERALPDLDYNIKCGNSLISSDYYHDTQLTLLDEDEMYRVNVFDWESGFPTIMKQGGFDIIIGNPPYLRIQGLQEYYQNQINYFIETYESAIKRFDLYCLFIERGFHLLSSQGYLSYICPHKFTNGDFASGLRIFLVSHQAIKSLISFGENLVFEQASTYTGIITISKMKNKVLEYYEFPKLSNLGLSNQLNNHNFSQILISQLGAKSWSLTSNINGEILKKIQQGKFTIGDKFIKVFQGIVTGIDEIYFLAKISKDLEKEDLIEVFSRRLKTTIKIEKSILKPVLKGENVSRYTEPDYNYYCIYPYKLQGKKTVPLEENEFKIKFPLAYEYLSQYKEEITQLRIKYKTNPKYWYICHRGRSILDFESTKIITPEISLGCNMTLNRKQFYFNTKVYALIPDPNCQENELYWLGLFNSKLMWWFIINTGYVLRGGYFCFTTNYLKPFPIYTIDFSQKSELNKHNKITQLVKKILLLNNKLSSEKIPSGTQIIAQQITAIDKQIDQLVYELYGLNEEEIAIIEQSYR